MCEVNDPRKNLFHLDKSYYTIIIILFKYILKPVMESHYKSPKSCVCFLN